MTLALLTAVLASLASSTPAARVTDVTDLCVNGDADVKIAACTRLLNEHGIGWTCAAHNNRALGYTKKHEYDKGLADLDFVVKECYEDDFSHFNRGLIHLRFGHWSTAIYDFSSTLENRPKFYPAMVERAAARLYNHEYSKAMEDLERASRIDNTYWRARVVRCEARALVGQELDAALTDAQALIDTKTYRDDGIAVRGLIEYRKGEQQKSVDDLNTALGSDTGDAILLYARGLAKRSTGDEAGAKTDFAAALAVNPHAGEVFASYGLN